MQQRWISIIYQLYTGFILCWVRGLVGVGFVLFLLGVLWFMSKEGSFGLLFWVYRVDQVGFGFGDIYLFLGEYQQVLQVMERYSLGFLFSVCFLVLRQVQFTFLLRVFKLYIVFRELRLVGNRLGDGCVIELLVVLGIVFNLIFFDLFFNYLGFEGLR